MSEYFFKVDNVYKHFGDTKALDGVSLKAPKATIFGLLGPNGAGKTTLVRILSTLSDPDKGSVKVLGMDVAKEADSVRRSIGLAGQFAAVDEMLTGRENISMVASLYHLKKNEIKIRTNELLEELDLIESADKLVRTYSGGMRRRLDLGASLIGRPKVLFLDEPTTGLDPRTRLGVWDKIRTLVKTGTSILLTTQYLEEADELADKIAVIDHGKVISEGTSNQLKSRLGGDVVEFQLEKATQKDAALAAVSSIANNKPAYDGENQTISLPVSDGSAQLTEIVRKLDGAKIKVTSLSLHRPSLDDVFLSLTGKKTAAVEDKTANKNQRQRG